MTKTNLCECKVRYEKTTENGTVKKVTETYLIDAMTITEAEARLVENIAPFITGEFDVRSIKKYNPSEIIFDESGDYWFKCKVAFISIDERTGVEKRIPYLFLVQAKDFDTANMNVKKAMEGSVTSWEFVDTNTTNIVDVFKCQSEQIKNETEES